MSFAVVRLRLRYTTFLHCVFVLHSPFSRFDFCTCVTFYYRCVCVHRFRSTAFSFTFYVPRLSILSPRSGLSRFTFTAPPLCTFTVHTVYRSRFRSFSFRFTLRYVRFRLRSLRYVLAPLDLDFCALFTFSCSFYIFTRLPLGFSRSFSAPHTSPLDFGLPRFSRLISLHLLVLPHHRFYHTTLTSRFVPLGCLGFLVYVFCSFYWIFLCGFHALHRIRFIFLCTFSCLAPLRSVCTHTHKFALTDFCHTYSPASHLTLTSFAPLVRFGYPGLCTSRLSFGLHRFTTRSLHFTLHSLPFCTHVLSLRSRFLCTTHLFHFTHTVYTVPHSAFRTTLLFCHCTFCV